MSARRSTRPLTAAAAALASAVAGSVAAVAGSLALAPTAHAAPTADYEMPFPCAQQWTGTTRSSHSPSSLAVDWNRPDDLGDPVVASAPATVTTARTTLGSGYGRYVVLDHGAGESTVYAHLQSVTVQLGQRVDQGAVIGFLGSTGNSSGPHLHYEQKLSGRVQAAWFNGAAFRYGSTQVSRNCLDVPLAANFVGDRRAEPVVFRRQTRAQFLIHREGMEPARLTLGTSTDEPVVGDWDGDGRANPGIRTPATAQFTTRTPQGITRITFGTPSDRGIAGDWDGNGRWEVGVHRARTGEFLLRAADGRVTSFRFGDADDVPVTGDWNGDGVTDVGVHDADAAQFTLRIVDADGQAWTTTVYYGEAGDFPVVGDWDANGRTDLGTWDPATATFSRRIAPRPTATSARTVTTVRFGRRR